MTNKWNYDDALKRALNAKRQAEAEIWAIVGSDPNTESNPYQAELDLGQNNTIYARLYDGLETITVRYDPASNPQLRYWGAAIALSIEDGEYWINGPYKPRLTAQQDGLDLPTDALHLRNHGHTSTSDGGPLGADIIDATHINDLTLATLGRLRQEANNTLSTIKDNLTATSDPTTGDDDLDGYSVLSFWLNTTTPELFICADNSTAAAEWLSITTGITAGSITADKLSYTGTSGIDGFLRVLSGGTFVATKYRVGATSPTVNDDNTQNYGVMSLWFNTSAVRQWVAMGVSAAAAVWKRYLFSGEVVPTDTSTLTGSSAAIVTQTASDTFSSIDYTLSANRPLIYDGSDIRNQYIEIVNGGSQITTSGTTASTVDTSSDLASIQNSSTLRLRMVSHLMLGASVASDRYRFQWQYNYDNGGAEDWQEYYNTDITFDAASSFKTVSLGVVFVGSSMTTQTWGFGGVYKVRLQVFRWAGTGALTIYSGGAGNYAKQTVWEELVQ